MRCATRDPLASRGHPLAGHTGGAAGRMIFSLPSDEGGVAAEENLCIIRVRMSDTLLGVFFAALASISWGAGACFAGVGMKQALFLLILYHSSPYSYQKSPYATYNF